MDYTREYENSIKRGEIIVGRKIQQALDRHNYDLEHKQDLFYYDPDKANDVIDFIELLPDPKTGKPLKLALFQKFIISQLYGWRSIKTGNRKYQKAYISMARKQGKSLLIAGISLYELIFGEKPTSNRQIYCSANSTDQSAILFSMIKAFAEKAKQISPMLNRALKTLNKRMDYKDEGFIRVVSSNASTLDGLDVLLGVIDEYHEAASNDMVEVLRSSQLQQEQPLILIITTVGFNLNYPIYTIEYPYASRILRRDDEGDDYLALIWEQDGSEEIEDERLWMKSNPILELEEGKDIKLGFLRSEIATGRAKRDMLGVLVKNFNIWQSVSNESYIRLEDWEANKLDKAPDIKGRPVYIGVDLAYSDDLNAVSWAVPIKEDKYFYVDSHVHVATTNGSIEEKQKRDKIDYTSLAAQGRATIGNPELNFIDTTEVAQWIMSFIKEHNLDLKGIFYDPAHGADFRNTLIRNGYDEKMFIVRQGPLTLSPATLQFKEDLIKGKVKHDGSPSLSLGIHNAIVKRTNDAVMLDKARNRNKIDSIAALINCWTEVPHYNFEEMNMDEYLKDFSF